LAAAIIAETSDANQREWAVPYLKQQWSYHLVNEVDERVAKAFEMPFGTVASAKAH